MLIKYNNGLVLQGVILSFGERLARVAIKDAGDAAEFRMINSAWVSEDCEVVHLEFAGQSSTIECHGDDFPEAMLTADATPVPVQRVM